MFARTDALIAVGFTALAFALHPSDRSIATHFHDQHEQLPSSLDRVAKGLDHLAAPGALVLGIGAYAFGAMTHRPTAMDIGWHATESILTASVITETIKTLAGRSRPFVTADSNPGDFRFGSGFTNDDRKSFPSGHTTVAFAAAAALTSEVHRLWPRRAIATGVISYAFATAVGLSRMYQDQHWATDVVVGAGIGTFAGLKTVRFSHLHPDNFIDRIVLGTTIAPDGRGGARLSVTLPYSPPSR